MPIAGGAVALALVLGLGYLFFGPREDLNDLPAVETPAPPADAGAEPTTAPEPAVDVAALEGAASQALAGVPCSQLNARVADNGGVSVHGVVSQSGDVARIDSVLGGIAGLGRVDTSSVLVESRPVCSAAALLDAAAHTGGVAVRTNHGDGVFRDGDYLVVYATAPPGPPVHLYVDFVDPGGDVVHLRPNPAAPESMVDGGSQIQLGVEAAGIKPGARYYQLGEPYGRAVVMVLASAAPLFSSPRPEVEPATTYLAALGQSLAAQGGEIQGGWQYLDIVAGE